MRRLIANSVLLVTLGSFFAPAMMAAVPNPIPICCRRGGAHRCAMMAQILGTTDGNVVRCNNPCPMQRGSQLGSSLIALPIYRTAQIGIYRQSLISIPLSSPHFTLAPADHLRGPPALLS